MYNRCRHQWAWLAVNGSTYNGVILKSDFEDFWRFLRSIIWCSGFAQMAWILTSRSHKESCEHFILPQCRIGINVPKKLFSSAEQGARAEQQHLCQRWSKWLFGNDMKMTPRPTNATMSKAASKVQRTSGPCWCRTPQIRRWSCKPRAAIRLKRLPNEWDWIHLGQQGRLLRHSPQKHNRQNDVLFRCKRVSTRTKPCPSFRKSPGGICSSAAIVLLHMWSSWIHRNLCHFASMFWICALDSLVMPGAPKTTSIVRYACEIL